MPPTSTPAEWLARVPPPYRLRCDLAVVPLLLPATAASRLATLAVPSFVGRMLAYLLLACYGPERRVYDGIPSSPGDLYREVSLAVPVRAGAWPSVEFTRMWVDAQDE